MRGRCIPLPIGMEVKFRWFKWDGWTPVPSYRYGYINKQMFPGYSYKNTNIEDMRYGITDKYDKDHNYVISEHLILNPNIYKLYTDKDYERSIITPSHRSDRSSNYSDPSGFKVKEVHQFGQLSLIPKRRKG